MKALKFTGSFLVFVVALLFYGTAVVLFMIGSALSGLAAWGAK